MTLIKFGHANKHVKELQENLQKLGYDLEADGKYGPVTKKAVLDLQTTWGYDADAIVGPGTQHCIEKRLAEGWNRKSPDAADKAKAAVAKAQAKAAEGKADGGKPVK